MSAAWSSACLKRFADLAIDPGVASALDLKEAGGFVIPPSGPEVWWMDEPQEVVLLADSIDDALALASVIYSVNPSGTLVRRPRLLGFLQSASLAVLPLPPSTREEIVEGLAATGPESIFAAVGPWSSALLGVVDLEGPHVPSFSLTDQNEYGAALAAVRKPERPELLARDVHEAFFAEAHAKFDRINALWSSVPEVGGDST